MSKRPSMLRSTARLLLLAFALAVVMAAQLAAGNGFLKAMLDGALPWQALLLAVSMTLVATFAIVNAFTATMRPEAQRLAGTVASAVLALAAGLEASHAVADLPVRFYFWTHVLADAAFAFAVSTVVVANVKVNGRLARWPARITAGMVLTIGVLGFVSQSWLSLERMALAAGLARDVGLALLAPTLAFVVAGPRRFRLEPASAKASLKLRLPTSPESRETRVALALIAGGALLTGVLSLVAHLCGGADVPGKALAPVLTLSLAWPGVAYLCLVELARFTGEERQGHVTARLAPVPAKRFLKRHLTEKQAWAATVGLKTTNFIVDHDPGGVLHNQLPASIMQIRAEEIQRCVTEVLGGMYLHSHVVGARIFGAVDPEAAVRPCVDTLRMFACLYLDAGPLVERRIKGLTALLPIVDPPLARVMHPKDVGGLIRRNLWFFHFDFGWIDQHVIHTPRATRYDVRLASLGSKVRHSMLDYLEKTGGVGNFVWLGPEARDRLLQEAPALRNIIEACPIATGEQGGETLMFTIKFEQLIPRLQRYFDLDSLRQALLDFEPSQESARLLNLLGLQIARAKAPGEVLDVLGSLISVPWRGFREKDNALQLILAAYEQITKMIGAASLEESDDPKLRALYDRLLDAVQVVGYPSQILHNAQISKIALRDLATLKRVASDLSHPRFTEAWLNLATTDYRRFAADERLSLLTFLGELGDRAALARERLVSVKAIDALVGLGRMQPQADAAPAAAAASRMAHWFATTEVDPDICAHFLDALTFLTAHLGPAMTLDASSHKRLDGYFKGLVAELGATHPKLVGVMSRWQDQNARQPRSTAA